MLKRKQPRKTAGSGGQTSSRSCRYHSSQTCLSWSPLPEIQAEKNKERKFPPHSIYLSPNKERIESSLTNKEEPILSTQHIFVFAGVTWLQVLLALLQTSGTNTSYLLTYYSRFFFLRGAVDDIFFFFFAMSSTIFFSSVRKNLLAEEWILLLHIRNHTHKNLYQKSATLREQEREKRDSRERERERESCCRKQRACQKHNNRSVGDMLFKP